MNEQQSTTTTAGEAESTTPIKLTSFTFRVLKSGTKKFDDSVNEFNASNTPYAIEYNDDKSEILSIKRSAVKIELPIFHSSVFTESFIAELIQEQVKDATRKEFIDNNKPVDLSVINPKWIEEALATRRASAVSVEAITSFAALMNSLLTTGGTNEATVKIFVELIKGRFGARVLKNYSQLREQFVGAAQKIERTLGTQDSDTVTEHAPVLELIANNLEKYLELDEEEVLDLDLS